MIDLGEGITSAEVRLIEVERGLCDSEHKLVSKELNEALTDEDSLWHIHGVVVLEYLVGTSADRVQVRRDLGCLLEIIDSHLILILIELKEPLDSCAFKDVASAVIGIAQIIARLNGVGDSSPVGRAQYDKRHLCFEVGLVKAWEDPESMEGLKLRVKILLLVGAVLEGVETNAIFIVGGQVTKLYGVPALHHVSSPQGNHLILEALRAAGAGPIVDHQVGHGESLRVNEEVFVVVRLLLQIEVDDGVAKIIVTFLQCKLEVVFDLLDESLAFACLLLREDDGGFELAIDDGIIAHMCHDKELFFARRSILVCFHVFVRYGFDHFSRSGFFSRK